MRVLHVISGIDAENGGPSIALAGLATAQARAGLDVSIIATWTRERSLATGEDLRGQGMDVHLIGPARDPLSRHPDLAPTVDRLVSTSHLLHIHALWEEIQHQAARAAQRLRVPYVIRPCGMLDPWSFARGHWKKRFYMAWRMRRNLNAASALHFTTETERDSASIHQLTAATIVEPNGVDLAEFQSLPPRGTFRDRHPQTKYRPLIVFLGRIHEGKGVEYLVPALARMKNAEAMLAVVGPDSKRFQTQMERLASELGVRERIVFAGLLRGRDKVAALADADMFALPSNHENFGIAVVEALAAGIPVIVSDQVHIHPQITAAGVGAAVPLDIDALAHELDRWLGDQRMRSDAAARARPFVWERYDWNAIARRWMAHYERLVATSDAGPRGPLESSTPLTAPNFFK